ncbi:hypothetical protein ACFY7C_22930 [Streptomyces sp. NPDC012769]|uniref:hypothetical protein n=1 Tax=Streptomyces sp. NPDC012769 TaxID=3364848 RepID=UPI0036B6B881
MEYGKRYGAGALLASVVALVAVAGCGQAPTAPDDRPDTTMSIPPAPSGPADGTTTATATAGGDGDEPAPQEVLVEVVVNGGLAGVVNKLVVHHDGSYTLRSGTKPAREGRMSAAGAAELRAALEDPAYAKVPARPTGGATVADGFTYYITHAYRLVVARDGEDRPAALQRVLDALPGGGPPTAP